MKHFLKKILSIENHINDNAYLVKVIKFLGLTFKIPVYKKLKPLNNFFVKLPPVYLSIVAISKNEAPYIKEWIEYHKLVGVERFYFYDNGSTDNTREVLEPYIKEGLVVYNYCEGKAMQIPAYADALYKYKNQTRWMAIIDLDEYIVPVEKDNIPDFLKDYEAFGGVGINWVVFDSSGHKTKPLADGGLITANYKCVKKDYNWSGNTHIKSIVNPKEVKSVFHPHFCVFKNKKYTVDENFKRVIGCFTEFHSSNKIRVNHYYCKSEEEYLKKVVRGRAVNGQEKPFYKDCLNFPNAVNDYVIQRFVPQLKKRMNVIEEIEK